MFESVDRAGQTGAQHAEASEPLSVLLSCGQKDLRSMEELDVGQFGGDADTLKAALGPAAAVERQQILIREMRGELIQIRLEGDRGGDTQIVGFGAGFFGETAEIRLRLGQKKETARAMASVGKIDGPDVNVLLLGVLDGGVEIGTCREIAVEVVDSRGNEKDGTALAGRGPALHQVLKREIWTGKRTGAHGQAKGFCGERMVVGEILRHHGLAIAPVRDGNVR